jgi:type IV secretion system protein VirB3
VVTGLLSAAGYGACRVAVAKDHNMFGILFLWATTKGRASRNALYWRGSSVSPFPVRPTRKAAEVICYV